MAGALTSTTAPVGVAGSLAIPVSLISKTLQRSLQRWYIGVKILCGRPLTATFCSLKDDRRSARPQPRIRLGKGFRLSSSSLTIYPKAHGPWHSLASMFRLGRLSQIGRAHV